MRQSQFLPIARRACSFTAYSLVVRKPLLLTSWCKEQHTTVYRTSPTFPAFAVGTIQVVFHIVPSKFATFSAVMTSRHWKNTRDLARLTESRVLWRQSTCVCRISWRLFVINLPVLQRSLVGVLPRCVVICGSLSCCFPGIPWLVRCSRILGKTWTRLVEVLLQCTFVARESKYRRRFVLQPPQFQIFDRQRWSPQLNRRILPQENCTLPWKGNTAIEEKHKFC